jgi:hypothetical protein
MLLTIYWPHYWRVIPASLRRSSFLNPKRPFAFVACPRSPRGALIIVPIHEVSSAVSSASPLPLLLPPIINFKWPSLKHKSPSRHLLSWTQPHCHMRQKEAVRRHGRAPCCHASPLPAVTRLFSTTLSYFSPNPLCLSCQWDIPYLEASERPLVPIVYLRSSARFTGVPLPYYTSHSRSQYGWVYGLESTSGLSSAVHRDSKKSQGCSIFQPCICE